MSDQSRNPQTDRRSLDISTPLDAMMNLQHTALEATQALLRQSRSIQQERTRQLQEELRQQEALQQQALALSWSVFYGPVGEGETDAAESQREATKEFRGPGAARHTTDTETRRDLAADDAAESHSDEAEEFQGPGATRRTTDAAGEGNTVDVADDPEISSRTAGPDWDGGSDDHGDSSVTDAEELGEPSTEVRTVPTSPSDAAENVAVDSDQPFQGRIHGIGGAHGQALCSAGIESIVVLADARPDTVADAADVSTDRATEWVERAGAVASRHVDVIDGIGDAHAADLHEGGIETLPALAAADAVDVATIAGVSEDRAAVWVDDARNRQQKQLRTIDGIGEKRAKRLREADIETLADLAVADAGHVAEATDASMARAAEWIRSAQA